MRKIGIVFLLIVFSFSAFAQIKHYRKSIFFETGKYELDSQSVAVLQRVLDSVVTYKSYRIMLKGNTDNVGDSTVNKQLSEKRVEATKAYFMENGAPESAFKWAAYGEEKPIADNETDDGKQKSRYSSFVYGKRGD